MLPALLVPFKQLKGSRLSVQFLCRHLEGQNQNSKTETPAPESLNYNSAQPASQRRARHFQEGKGTGDPALAAGGSLRLPQVFVLRVLEFRV